MNDTFDDELRRSLHTQADRIPRVPDLSRGAIRQAHSIRRRRRIASGVAAAALVAVALPIGLKVGDAVSRGQDPVEPPTPSGPTQVQLDLQTLSAGDSPSIPYLDGRTVVADEGEIKIPGPSDIGAIAPVDDGVYVQTGDSPWQLIHYGWDGTAQELGPIVVSPVAAADGEWIVYGTGDTDPYGIARGDVTLHLVEIATGAESTVTIPGADALELRVLAVTDDGVYFTYSTPRGRDVGLQVWDPSDGGVTPVAGGDLNATAVSPDTELIGHLTKIVDFGSCSAMLDQNSGEELWRTCKYQIRGFSPDSRFVWATPAYADGYGPTTVSVLDARTGELVRHFKAEFERRHQLTFPSAVFENESRLLLYGEQYDGGAVLRCDIISGECVAAEPLADGTVDGFDAPYLLPSIG